MQHKKNIEHRTINKTALLYGTLLVLATTLVLIGLYFYNNNSEEQRTNSEQQEAKTTSTIPSAQEDFSSDSDRKAAERNEKGQASVNDAEGVLSELPSESQWVTSSNGEITVYGPAIDSLIISGASIIGESSLDQVNFRIIDSISGVLSQGSLQVVNGKFAGSLVFETNATKGRLDLYASKEDGSEYANVEIPILYK